MSKTQIFIEKAHAKHGDRFSYDRVVYVRSLDKVIITCKIHGDFEQIPKTHLRGQGCAKCGIESSSAKKTQKAKNRFVDKASAKNGDRYSYDRVVYVRSNSKVTITCKKHGDFEQTPNHHLSGGGCAKCGIESSAAKRSEESKNSFIARSRAVHGDLYNYSKAVYIRSNDKVAITCKIHGDFEQTPDNHLRGRGCVKCAGLHRYSTQEWVQEAIGVHGDRYGYERVVYTQAHEKVIITCANHGDFEQAPNHHLQGKGCAICGFESTAAKKTQKGRDSFIERSRAVHGNRYDYSKTVYVRDKDKVIIICAKHGDFEQRPNNHLTGNGCAKCVGKHAYSTREWVQEAIAVHGDRYDYERVVYTQAHEKVIITCANHGDFEQTPSSHLRGSGCPSCPKRYDQPTNLYLMHNGLGKVKVGYSIDADRRISQLNSTAPFKAELLETWTLPDTPTAFKIESKVHRKLAKYHAGLSGFDGATEWFNASTDTARKHILKALIGAEVLGHSEADSLQLALI